MNKKLLKKIVLLAGFCLSLAIGYILPECIAPTVLQDATVNGSVYLLNDGAVDIGENKSTEIEFHLTGSFFPPEAIELELDDCINALSVNGKAVTNIDLPYCDHQKPILINLQSLLTEPVNTITIKAENFYKHGYLIVKLHWGLGRILLAWLAVSISGMILVIVMIRLFPMRFATAFSFVVIGLSSAPLISRLIYELWGPITWDSQIYWGMAQVLLDGRRIYTDFFDTKTPLVGVLSMPVVLADNPFEASGIMQALFLLLLLFVFVYAACSGINEKARATPVILSSGIMITFYSAVRSGEFQIESFGAALGSLFIYLYFTRSTPSFYLQIFSAFLILATVGLKEPFIFSLIAACLVGAKSFEHFTKALLIPSIAAVIMAVILFYYGDWLYDYFTVYFPYMLFGYSGFSPRNWTELINKFINIRMLYWDIKAVSPGFAWVIISLGLYGVFYHLFRSRTGAYRLPLLIIALALTNLAVSFSGRFYNHYFVLAVPFYAALVFEFSRLINANYPKKLGKSGSSVILVTSLCLAYMIHIVDPGSLRRQQAIFRFERKTVLKTAKYIDYVQEHCGFSEYVWLGNVGGNLPLGLTKVSPLFGLNISVGLHSNNQTISNYIRSGISFKKPLLVSTDQYALDNFMQGYFSPQRGNFSDKLPACAEPVPAEIPGNVKILFPVKD